MQVDLEDYNVRSKIFLGNNLIVIFQHRHDIAERRVLELKEVVGFIDHGANDNLVSLRIDDGSSYAFDLSLRLSRDEIKDFEEALLFIAGAGGRFGFRACAKNILFRDWTEDDVWLK
ncbi:hypothetical protein [Chitinophaga pinensis]|uniref:Uncharacterized protein n=1 Tax=Chitinophaga pinensis (strain ATCC 43595 / DSM 2588 / LMG 13176 / NBRC 15968 / NCIMB 11800 / UQM 2034) TaxID=485918 RepID=A0A979G1T5_CHIPD|nr:hypothetical protein [Chitinophaga pinensis]ACU59038.1 hypothetical protein Cpin_1541 [Chitinophaga pinensis DSM 2588]